MRSEFGMVSFVLSSFFVHEFDMSILLEIDISFFAKH